MSLLGKAAVAMWWCRLIPTIAKNLEIGIHMSTFLSDPPAGPQRILGPARGKAQAFFCHIQTRTPMWVRATVGHTANLCRT